MQDRLVWTDSVVAVVSIEVAEKGSSVIVKTQSEAESSGIQKLSKLWQLWQELQERSCYDENLLVSGQYKPKQKGACTMVYCICIIVYAIFTNPSKSSNARYKIQLRQAQESTQGLLTPQDTNERWRMETSPTAASKMLSCLRDNSWSGLIQRPETKEKESYSRLEIAVSWQLFLADLRFSTLNQLWYRICPWLSRWLGLSCWSALRNLCWNLISTSD